MSRKSLAFVLSSFAALVVAAETVTYSDDATVTEPLQFTEDLEISVASGKTVTYEGAITSGTGLAVQFTKSGAGTLILKNAGNVFAGGIRVAAGYLVAQAEGCLGDQLITMDGGQLRFDVKNATFANPITLARDYIGPDDGTGTATASAGLHLFFPKNVTLTGGIAADGRTLRIGCSRLGSDSGNSNWAVATFDCEVNLGGTGTLMFHANGAYGNFKFMRKVTCGTFNSGDAWSAMGKVYFYVENAIGKYIQDSSVVYLYHADALKGTEFYHVRCWNTGRGTVYPQVADFNIAMFNAVTQRYGDYAPSNSDKTGADVTGSDAYTVHITGAATNVASYVRFKGAGTLIQEAVGQTAESFVQTFDYVPSTMTGALIVSNGTMRLTNGGGFPNASSIYVGEGAVLDCRSTSADMLAGATKVRIDGTLTVAEASGVQLNSAGDLDLELGPNASFSYVQPLMIKKLKVNGVNRPAGSYTHANLPQLAEGASLTVLPAGDAVAEFGWTGAGADVSVATAANWEDATVVDALASGMIVPVFATGGTRAEIGSSVFFNGLKFDAAGDFAVEGATGGALQLGQTGITTVAPASGTRDYAIRDVPITYAAPQTINLATNTTLTIRDGLAVAGTHSTEMTGSGKLVLEGVNRFDGPLKHSAGTTSDLVIRGLVSSSTGADQGAAAFNGANTITVYVPFSDRNNKTSRLRFENATIEKPLATVFIDQNSLDTIVTFTCAANTTNVIAGDLYTVGQNCYAGMEKDSTLIVKGRIRSNTFTSVGSACATVIYSNCTASASSSENIYMRGGTNYFHGTGWNLNSRLCCDGGHGVMMNDNVFTPSASCRLVMGDFWGGGNAAGDLNLNGTRQTFPVLMATKRSSGANVEARLFTPEDKPAVLAITGTHATTSTNSADIIGPVTIEKSGDKAFYTMGRAVRLSGALKISGGLFDIAASASYPNASAVELSGTAQLALHANDQLSHEVVLKVKDTATVSIPEGVIQVVGALWFGDATKPVKSGIYGGSDCTVEGVDKTYAAYFTGAGCVKVRRGGTMIIVK